MINIPWQVVRDIEVEDCNVTCWTYHGVLCTLYMCCWETMLCWMFGTDRTSEQMRLPVTSTMFNFRLKSLRIRPLQLRPISSNASDWVMIYWRCTLSDLCHLDLCILKGLLWTSGFLRKLKFAQNPVGLIFSLFLVLLSRTCTKAPFGLETSRCSRSISVTRDAMERAHIGLPSCEAWKSYHQLHS